MTWVSCAFSSFAQVGPETTYVIDAEFAFYGPIFFDVGKYLGNLLLAFLSIDGRATAEEPRAEQRRWVLESIGEVWRTFSARFVELWTEEGAAVRRLLPDTPAQASQVENGCPGGSWPRRPACSLVMLPPAALFAVKVSDRVLILDDYAIPYISAPSAQRDAECSILASILNQWPHIIATMMLW